MSALPADGAAAANRGVPERLWVALFVLPPLFYNPLSRWQYEPDKVALVLVLTGLLVGHSLARGAISRPARCRVEWWVAGWLAVRLLTVGNSIAPHWSLWGDPAYRNGFLLALTGAALFFLSRRQLTTPRRRADAANSILIGSAFIAGYGVLQYAGLDPFAQGGYVRVPSTLAHPNLLAAYLAMVIPLTAMCLVRGARRVWAGALLLLQSLCLLFTYSRAGWLAALAALAVWGSAELWIRGRRRAAGTLVIGLAAGLAVLFALSLLPPLPGTAPHALQTLTSIFRWGGATVQIRLLGWRACLEAIGRRPWLGFGPATFRIVIEWFLPPELAPFGGAAALGGRAHNSLLEMLIESGWVGLAGYLAMIGAIVISLVRTLRQGDADSQHFGAGVLGALAGNVVTGLFSFDSAATTVLFWSLAGMGLAGIGPGRRVRGRQPLAGWMVGAGSILLASWMMVPDVIAFLGDAAAGKELWRESIDLMGLASDLGPTPEAFLLAQGNAYAVWAESSHDAAVWRQGQAVYDRLLAKWPGVVRHWEAGGLFWRRWGLDSSDMDALHRSLAAYTEAIRLSPGDPDLRLDRGLVLVSLGDLDRALGDFQEANAMLPEYMRYYGAMSVYALASGDGQAASVWQQRALEAQQAWDAWAWRR